MKAIAGQVRISWRVRTVKEKLWLPFVTRLAYRIEKELYNAIGFLRQQPRKS